MPRALCPPPAYPHGPPSPSRLVRLPLLALASAPVLLARLTLGADNALVPYYALLLVLGTSGWHQLWRRTLVSHTSAWGAEIEPNEAAVGYG